MSFFNSKIGLVFFVTFLRIPVAIAFALTIAYVKQTWSVIGLEVIFLGLIELTDFSDGFLARKWGVVTEGGALFDPFADSASRLIVFWSLAYTGHALALVPLVMALRDIIVAYSRILMASRQVSVRAKLSGKIKAVVQAVVSFLLVLGPLFPIYQEFHLMAVISWIVIIATSLSAVEYVMSGIQALKRN